MSAKFDVDTLYIQHRANSNKNLFLIENTKMEVCFHTPPSPTTSTTAVVHFCTVAELNIIIDNNNNDNHFMAITTVNVCTVGQQTQLRTGELCFTGCMIICP